MDINFLIKNVTSNEYEEYSDVLNNNKYSTEYDVLNLIKYIGNTEKCLNKIYGGRNIEHKKRIFSNPDYIVNQFLFYQGESNKKRRVYHIICSFSTAWLSKSRISMVGKGLCGMYQDFQSIYTVHENTDNIHMHIVFNNYPICQYRKKLSYYLNIPKMYEVARDLIMK